MSDAGDMSWPRGNTDPFEYARLLIDKERKERHGVREIAETAVQNTANHTRDLSRNDADPGWVHSRFKVVEEDVTDLQKAVSGMNKKLNAIFVAVALAALGLIGNLLMELLNNAKAVAG